MSSLLLYTDSILLGVTTEDFEQLLKDEYRPKWKKIKRFLFEDSQSPLHQAGLLKACEMYTYIFLALVHVVVVAVRGRLDGGRLQRSQDVLASQQGGGGDVAGDCPKDEEHPKVSTVQVAVETLRVGPQDKRGRHPQRADEPHHGLGGAHVCAGQDVG
jgi:hypothetical protein